jgi:hypothetical protein
MSAETGDCPWLPKICLNIDAVKVITLVFTVVEFLAKIKKV